ncbi:hypothetical protein ED733_003541 [Metarhizium rileyi]|uniref:Heat shock protein Hsp70 n=1 Tax=Metarhizium rileyi (strain RCEF 4871) TaxID=1649241 RepID=A0A5C6G3Z2_METRR|nr:hypothetical protein ED733_003541 [Metarhizium rileyi]
MQRPKIPTVISYNSGSTEKFTWGASVDTNAKDAIVGIKLLLDPEQTRPMYLPTSNIKKDLKALPKPAVEIAADFIGAVYNHALQEIAKTVPRAYMKLCNKEFVLSVPAVWSDAAKIATLKAAQTAGIHPVTLIKEPEAAALHIVKELGFSMRENDAYIICDAGGGTVDLISYQVEQVLPRLELKELVPGSGELHSFPEYLDKAALIKSTKGGMAGSLGLNKRFASAVQALVGDEQWLTLKRGKGWALAEKQFDQEIKRAFKGDVDEEYFVNFPLADLWDDPEGDLVSNTWRMTGGDLKQIFEPLVKDILNLIELQVKEVEIKRPNSGISGIMLVGGFGSNIYLRERIKAHFNGIEVLQPEDAWAAIVKGAALSKLPQQAAVTSISSTKHYGTAAWSIYDPHRDAGQATQIQKDGSERVEKSSKMSWFIHIGDDIRRDQKVKYTFIHILEEDDFGKEMVFSCELWECQDRTPPVYPSKSRNLKTNCIVKWDATGIPISKCVQRTGPNGKVFYDLFFDLIVTLESALMTFSVEFEGRTMGSVEADLVPGRDTVTKLLSQ